MKNPPKPSCMSFFSADNLSPNQLRDIQSYLNRLLAMKAEAEESDLLDVSRREASSSDEDVVKKVVPKGRETRNASPVSARVIRQNQNFRNWLYLRTRRAEHLAPVELY